jgi:hypothetical protein
MTYWLQVVRGCVPGLWVFAVSVAYCQTPPVPWNQNFGQFSVSSGFSYAQQSRRATTTSNTESLPNGFAFVLTHRISVQASPSIFKSVEKSGQSRNSGFGDTNFAASCYLTRPDASHTFAAVLGYVVKVPTSDRLVSSSRELDHVITVNLQDTPKSYKRLGLQLEPGVGFFGKNTGGDLTKAVLSLRESFVINPTGAVLGNKWTFKNETACYSAASKSPADCSDTLRLSHIWRLLSGTIEVVGGPKIGLTPFSPRIGFVVSVSRAGSFLTARPKKGGQL